MLNTLMAIVDVQVEATLHPPVVRDTFTSYAPEREFFKCVLPYPRPNGRMATVGGNDDQWMVRCSTPNAVIKTEAEVCWCCWGYACAHTQS